MKSVETAKLCLLIFYTCECTVKMIFTSNLPSAWITIENISESMNSFKIFSGRHFQVVIQFGKISSH